MLYFSTVKAAFAGSPGVPYHTKVLALLVRSDRLREIRVDRPFTSMEYRD
jgi:hypothetical protein